MKLVERALGQHPGSADIGGHPFGSLPPFAIGGQDIPSSRNEPHRGDAAPDLEGPGGRGGRQGAPDRPHLCRDEDARPIREALTTRKKGPVVIVAASDCMLNSAPDPRVQAIVKPAILAVAGQGGGVLTGWIKDLARANGCVAQATSVAGVAQRTGATISSMAMPPDSGRLPVFARAPAVGMWAS
jgi:TPP-dependent indolepyruvate ferredoxin oxidoreductase alpha subunit